MTFLFHYGLDIVKDKNDDMFIPASIAIDIISINAGWPMAFNGKDFYSIYAMFGGEDNNLISQYYYDSPYCAISTRSAEMADFAYKELAFAIETFYGLSGDCNFTNATNIGTRSDWYQTTNNQVFINTDQFVG